MSDFLGQEQSDDQWGPDSDCSLDNEDILLYEEGESEFEDDGSINRDSDSAMDSIGLGLDEDYYQDYFE